MRAFATAIWLVIAANLTGCRTESSQLGEESQALRAGSSSIPMTDAAVLDASGSDASEGGYHVAIRFSDVSEDLGFRFHYESGREAGLYSMLEFVGGGIGVLDFDGDGFPDVFLPGGGEFTEDRILGKSGCLMRNVQGAKFAAVALQAGDGFPSKHYSHGAAVGDLNADGFPDFVVTGYEGIAIWINHGDGTFSEVSQELGIVDPLWSTSAGWGDINGDGLIDLYLVHYLDWTRGNDLQCFSEATGERDICPPRAYDPQTDSLFLAAESGKFFPAGNGMELREGGKGLGVLIADLNLDGHSDIYVANDSTENFLYLNERPSSLKECGMIHGVAVDILGKPNGSMGIALLDFDANGLPDIWVTNFVNELFALYRNEGAGTFLEIGNSQGMKLLGRNNVGFGTLAEDFNLDGVDELFVSNGHTYLVEDGVSPRRQLPMLLERRGGIFRLATFDAENYMGKSWLGRGLAGLDFDQDGDTDLVVSHLEDTSRLLRNETESGGNWVRVKLVGRRSNRDAVGATAVLTIVNRQVLKQRVGGGSYLSSSQAELCWGVGDATTVGPLEVRWPSGHTTKLEQVGINETRLLVEPSR